MSHTFAPIPAKPTFGTIQPLLYSSDYLLQKKAQTLFATKQYKNPIPVTYENMYLYFPKFLPFPHLNRGNLIYGLYSKENLLGVTTVGMLQTTEEATSINPNSVPFYDYYTIDPKGQLFGNSQCGINNFVYYAEPNTQFIKQTIKQSNNQPIN